MWVFTYGGMCTRRVNYTSRIYLLYRESLPSYVAPYCNTIPSLSATGTSRGNARRILINPQLLAPSGDNQTNSATIMYCGCVMRYCDGRSSIVHHLVRGEISEENSWYTMTTGDDGYKAVSYQISIRSNECGRIELIVISPSLIRPPHFCS